MVDRQLSNMTACVGLRLVSRSSTIKTLECRAVFPRKDIKNLASPYRAFKGLSRFLSTCRRNEPVYLVTLVPRFVP